MNLAAMIKGSLPSKQPGQDLLPDDQYRTVCRVVENSQTALTSLTLGVKGVGALMVSIDELQGVDAADVRNLGYLIEELGGAIHALSTVVEDGNEQLVSHARAGGRP